MATTPNNVCDACGQKINVLTADAISARIKDALARAKERGVLLGSRRPGHWDGKEQVRLNALSKARKVAASMRGRQKLAAYAEVMPVLVEMRSRGYTYRQIAAHLNAAGHTSRRGKKWSVMLVMNVLRLARS